MFCFRIKQMTYQTQRELVNTAVPRMTPLPKIPPKHCTISPFVGEFSGQRYYFLSSSCGFSGANPAFYTSRLSKHIKLEYMIWCKRMDNENEASPENKQSFQDIFDKDLIISDTITIALLLCTFRMFHTLSYVFYEIKQRITLFKPCIDIFEIKMK